MLKCRECGSLIPDPGAGSYVLLLDECKNLRQRLEEAEEKIKVLEKKLEIAISACRVIDIKPEPPPPITVYTNNTPVKGEWRE
jgi:hypothetical protein